MPAWRFDQGRLDYFRFDEVKKIAHALVELDGKSKPGRDDPDIVRIALKKYSNLPFAPDNYYVWRNYSRVFGFLLLGTDIDGVIYATDLCKDLVSTDSKLDCDDYLAHVARNFYYPSPVFQGYAAQGQLCFPIVAIIKFLISTYRTTGKDYVTLEEIEDYLISNQVTGLEDIKDYKVFTRGKSDLSGDENRQLREMVSFVSQFSFLTLSNSNLYLNVVNDDELNEILSALQPVIRKQETDRRKEILHLGRRSTQTLSNRISPIQVESIEEEFVEGKKVRVTHLRSERNGKLKSLYFSTTANPSICDMCQTDTASRYPWVDHVIELHHLLPLSSPVRVESKGTSLRDLVGLCPSCHRATHKYYSAWLKRNDADDFQSHEEALNVYNEAKKLLKDN